MADTVLDDALADFDIPADKLQAAALADKLQDASITDFQKDASADGLQGPAAASSSAAPVLNGASSAAHDSTSASKPFSPLPERKEKSTSAGGFDPLGKGNLKKKAKAKNPPASRKADNPSEASSDSSSRPQPPGKHPASQTTSNSSAKESKEVDTELAQGMAQLMADLAKADGRMGAEQGPQTAGKHGPHEREMASTLAALAAAAPSSGEAPGLEQQGDADGSFASLADTIMQQLLSKDVLYQPMKDIGAKYPGWLAAHRDSLPAGEVQRYEAQYRFIQQICALYEEEANDFGRLFTLIQEMQACGQPPDEIVQDLAPGLAFGDDGLPQLPSSATDKCTIC
ncbi:g11443 [Coccomyxa viridis]|uniref:G11443 protein n=1 Tax=Coccomyxa viridis TaxID=1274662 RepID=A0ABP1G842_9CHLO